MLVNNSDFNVSYRIREINMSMDNTDYHNFKRMSRSTCKGCGHRYKVLVNNTCFFCDQKGWKKHWDKELGGKKK